MSNELAGGVEVLLVASSRTRWVAACLVVAGLATAVLAGPAACLTFAPGRVVVVVEESSATSAALSTWSRAGVLSAPRDLASLGIQRARPLGIRSAAPTKHRLRFYVLESDDAQFDPMVAARALKATGRYRAACPDYRFDLANTIPNDPQFGRQWYLDDGGVHDVRAPAAWDTTRGSEDQVIAILDTGVDLGHPDLSSNLWINSGEIAGNSIDDDGNGYVDDVHGWDFSSDDSDPNPELTLNEDGDDQGYHGTFCAGIAAAATDDGYGNAGAGWRCRVMSLKIFDPTNHIIASNVAAAFAYAVDHGATVLSVSFGGPADEGVPEFYQALVDFATDAGVVCVAAAGNDDDSEPFYPAASNNVLSVAATTPSGTRALFSNYGSWVKIAAPGVRMWSTLARNYRFAARDSLYFANVGEWDGVDPHMYDFGTSYAAPLVAGICGLVRSRFPALQPRQVIQHVIATGDAVAYDRPIGPRVNAFRAVSTQPSSLPDAWPFRLAVTGPNPGPGGFTVRYSLEVAGAVKLAVFDLAGRRVRTLTEGFQDVGPHRIRWDGTDEGGHSLSDGVYFVRFENEGRSVGRKVILLRK
jgi:subtilisin family serine protease